MSVLSWETGHLSCSLGRGQRAEGEMEPVVAGVLRGTVKAGGQGGGGGDN